MKSAPFLWLALLPLLCLTACGDDKPAPSAKPAIQTNTEPAVPPAQHKFTNKLAGETSPYLLQHSHNPVKWHPWGKEAFEKAKRENKPIFLSVGYSTCYWCHVMERESFEQEDVAKIINEHYVAIKVDREELPDIDEQYMLATQLLTGRGGWPNSVWLTPAGKPWMAGTYFPKEQFMGVLVRMNEIWIDRREIVDEQAEQLAAAIRRNSSTLATQLGQVELGRGLIDPAFSAMRESFDPTLGGFGSAPKFPPHGQLALLVQELQRQPSNDLEKMLVTTLDSMWQGGLHDQVGGGFHRYSTDAQWLLPHFEKMLYDNAQLMQVYAAAYELTRHERYKTAVADIYRWLQREMTHAQGGFYSALDSESEGEEGRFYVWSLAELAAVLEPAEAKLFAEVYNLTAEGNFVEERTGEQTGHNIPHLKASLQDVAEARNLPVEELNAKLAGIREKLLTAREKWEYPHRDDKIITAWNGLMITALARAGRLLEEPKYTAAAERGAEFLWTNMWKDQMLLRTWREGEAKIPGYLNDYAFFAEGLLELHRTTEEDRWLQQAQQLTDAMLLKFEDREAGGFFFASTNHDDLIARSKNLHGGGNLPSGNGVAASVLIQLAEATNQPKYAGVARHALDSFSGIMSRAPLAAESLLVATEALLESKYAKLPPVDANAVLAFTQKPLAVSVYASRKTVALGEKVVLKVQLTIDPQWHLYGPNKGNEFLVPTTVTVGEQVGFTAGEIRLPKAKKQADLVQGETVEIYEGAIAFEVPITIGADAAAGPITIPLTLHTQACDARRCDPPVTKLLEVVLEIVGDGE